MLTPYGGGRHVIYITNPYMLQVVSPEVHPVASQMANVTDQVRENSSAFLVRASTAFRWDR